MKNIYKRCLLARIRLCLLSGFTVTRFFNTLIFSFSFFASSHLWRPSAFRSIRYSCYQSSDSLFLLQLCLLASCNTATVPSSSPSVQPASATSTELTSMSFSGSMALVDCERSSALTQPPPSSKLVPETDYAHKPKLLYCCFAVLTILLTELLWHCAKCRYSSCFVSVSPCVNPWSLIRFWLGLEQVNITFETNIKFGKLILRKTMQIVATICQILRLKFTKFDIGWPRLGLSPRPCCLKIYLKMRY